MVWLYLTPVRYNRTQHPHHTICMSGKKTSCKDINHICNSQACGLRAWQSECPNNLMLINDDQICFWEVILFVDVNSSVCATVVYSIKQGLIFLWW